MVEHETIFTTPSGSLVSLKKCDVDAFMQTLPEGTQYMVLPTDDIKDKLKKDIDEHPYTVGQKFLDDVFETRRGKELGGYSSAMPRVKYYQSREGWLYLIGPTDCTSKCRSCRKIFESPRRITRCKDCA